MKPTEIIPGSKITVMYKGYPFCNSIVLRVFDGKFGGTYAFVKGNYNEFGDPEPVSAQDLRPLTKGFYDSNPNKQNGIEK
jgi:hypothetical protein